MPALNEEKPAFVKLSTDPATLHQAFHYADIAVPPFVSHFLDRSDSRHTCCINLSLDLRRSAGSSA